MSLASIAPANLADLQTRGVIDLIDVRTPAEFNSIHAVGARLMPLASFDPAAMAASRTAPPGTPFYLLCHSGMRATEAANRCLAAGISDIVVVTGGTKAWEAAGLPVVRGTGSSFGVERQVRCIIGAGVLTGAILGYVVHPAWIGLSGFFGAGLLFAGLSDTCALALVVARMPWNRGAPAGGSCCVPQPKA